MSERERERAQGREEEPLCARAYIRHKLPISKRTVDSAPNREVPPGHASIFSLSSAAITAACLVGSVRKGLSTASRYCMGVPTNPEAMNACVERRDANECVCER